MLFKPEKEFRSVDQQEAIVKEGDSGVLYKFILLLDPVAISPFFRWIRRMKMLES